MNYLTPILPCRSRDDIGEPRSAAQADALLAAWTALWHPALIATAHRIPNSLPAASPPEDPAEHLILIPPTAEPLLPDEWLDHANQLGARLVRGKRTRSEMVAATLATLESPPDVDADLTADFLALGYAHFVIETITVAIRYASNLDEAGLEREVVQAAVAACAGDKHEATTRLQAAFDVLHTARDYYYASESNLLDLTLVASTTLGESLRVSLRHLIKAGEGLGAATGASESPPSSPDASPSEPSSYGRSEVDAGPFPCNLLMSAAVLEQMAAREPATLEELRQALQDGRASIVGGEYDELELPLMPVEAIRGQLLRGLAVYQKHLGDRPKVFGRRRFGLTPVLPQILEQLGFTGAIHATLDDGRFPTAGTSRQRWEGLDGSTIEAVFRVPIDAAQSEGFVRLPHALSGVGDMDNQPTAVFAHWPGQASAWYRDIQRVRRYSNVLGAFRTLTDYFDQTGASGHQTTPTADEYRAPYLRQAVAAGQSDSISRWQRFYARRAAAETAETLAALARLAGVKPATSIAGIVDDVDAALALPTAPDGLTERLAAAVAGAGDDVVRGLGVAVAATKDKAAATAPAAIVAVNPASFTRRVCVDVSALAAPPAVVGPVLCVEEDGGRRSAVVDIPPLGFVCLRPREGLAAPQPEKRWFGLVRKSAERPPIARRLERQGDFVLRNEFFELAIDPYTGAIRTLFDFRTRGPRLAQQIAMLLPGEETEGVYSIPAADDIRIVSAGPVLGEVAVRGRLLDRTGRLLAGFRQTTRVTYGSRVIELDIELDPQRQPDADPWNSYYAARFAWSEDVPTLYRGVNQAVLATDLQQFESPQFIDVRSEAGRTTILTAGLPYHRRRGMRRLDSLLIVRGETARRFRLGIGLDLPQPMAAAIDFLTPAVAVPVAAPTRAESAWLFHLDQRAVVATHWEPVVEHDVVCGFRVRLLETEGRYVELGLRSFRAVRSANKIPAPDRPPVDLRVEGDHIVVSLRPHEWAELDVRLA